MNPHAAKTLKSAEILRFTCIFLGFLTALVALVVLYRQHAPAANEVPQKAMSLLQIQLKKTRATTARFQNIHESKISYAKKPGLYFFKIQYA